MRQIIFDGRIGKNGAELKQTQNGKTYARFSVANATFSNGEEKTDWFDVTWFDPNEKIVEYMTSGTYVIVTGNVRFEQKIGKDGRMWLNIYVTAKNVDKPSIGRKNDGENGVNAESNDYNHRPQPQATYPNGNGYVQQQQPAYQQAPQPQYQQPKQPKINTQYQQQPQVGAQPQINSQGGYPQQGYQPRYTSNPDTGEPVGDVSGRQPGRKSMLEQKTIDPDYYSTEIEPTVPGVAHERIVDPSRIQLPPDDPARGSLIETDEPDDLPF